MDQSIDTKADVNDWEIAPSGAASTLFWMLPGPAAFLEQVAAALNRYRAVAIRLNQRTVLGHQAFIGRALALAAFAPTDAIEDAGWILLNVHDASQIDCDIAQHLCAQDGRPQIQASSLADWHTRHRLAQGEPASAHIIILRPNGEVAQRAAWAYLSEFARALPGSCGNTRVILLRIDNEPAWKATDLEELERTGQFAAASFDGALSPDEMASYLGMRLTICGFGGTPSNVVEFPMKRLARALIAEFAGFDAHFAEGLLKMSQIELLALPQSLGALAARMPVSDTVWRQTSPELGTLTTLEGRTIVHPLHQWHLASHPGRFREAAAKELERMKWRAYLFALMPWFEELRHVIIDELSPLLSLHLAQTNGERVRLTRNGKEVRTKIVDLECNDIHAMTRDEPRLSGRTVRERAALDLCFQVSRVRNEIAHMRAPQVFDIQHLIGSLKSYPIA